MGCCGGGRSRVVNAGRNNVTGKAQTVNTQTIQPTVFTVTCPDGTQHDVEGIDAAHDSATACGGLYSEKKGPA